MKASVLLWVTMFCQRGAIVYVQAEKEESILDGRVLPTIVQLSFGSTGQPLVRYYTTDESVSNKAWKVRGGGGGGGGGVGEDVTEKPLKFGDRIKRKKSGTKQKPSTRRQLLIPRYIAQSSNFLQDLEWLLNHWEQLKVKKRKPPPMYPPLDRDKLYSDGLLMYMKDFHDV